MDVYYLLFYFSTRVTLFTGARLIAVIDVHVH